MAVQLRLCCAALLYICSCRLQINSSGHGSACRKRMCATASLAQSSCRSADAKCHAVGQDGKQHSSAASNAAWKKKLPWSGSANSSCAQQRLRQRLRGAGKHSSSVKSWRGSSSCCCSSNNSRSKNNSSSSSSSKTNKMTGLLQALMISSNSASAG